MEDPIVIWQGTTLNGEYHSSIKCTSIVNLCYKCTTNSLKYLETATKVSDLLCKWIYEDNALSLTYFKDLIPKNYFLEILYLERAT